MKTPRSTVWSPRATCTGRIFRRTSGASSTWNRLNSHCWTTGTSVWTFVDGRPSGNKSGVASSTETTLCPLNLYVSNRYLCWYTCNTDQLSNTTKRIVNFGRGIINYHWYLEKYSKAVVFFTLIAGQIVIEGNGNSYSGTLSLTAKCVGLELYLSHNSCPIKYADSPQIVNVVVQNILHKKFRTTLSYKQV